MALNDYKGVRGKKHTREEEVKMRTAVERSYSTRNIEADLSARRATVQCMSLAAEDECSYY